jgi:hypothetical protein
MKKILSSVFKKIVLFGRRLSVGTWFHVFVYFNLFVVLDTKCKYFIDFRFSPGAL